MSNGRLAGLIDWSAIEDRTRNLHSLSHWTSPSQLVAACARQFRIDLWAYQEYRPEVWVEKEALAGVFEGICDELRVPMFCCRGYTSQSEMWVAGQRLREYVDDGKNPVIFHFGDHDPSGIDMTRDIRDRLEMFMGEDAEGSLRLERIALNREQIDEYNPPPNPAKTTDSRYDTYMEQYGDESWELDALEPRLLADLVRTNVNDLIDQAAWERAVQEEQEHRRRLQGVANNWDEVSRRVEGE